jgi:hypothetical protein
MSCAVGDSGTRGGRRKINDGYAPVRSSKISFELPVVIRWALSSAPSSGSASRR